MRSIVVNSPTVTSSQGRVRISSRIQLGTEDIEVWFRGPEDVLSPVGADPFLIVCLTSAMACGVPLVIEGGVSPRLLAATETAQDIYHRWYPALTKVAVEAEVRTPKAVWTGGAASFFSGGVDSFYTAFKHPQEITTLILVHGFDISIRNADLHTKVRARLAPMAATMGKRLVEIETNSRELTDRYVSWPDIQFGPALASVAVLLGGVAAKVYVAASESYAHLEPCGSHPLLDPLWSTEEIEIQHDGAEASRNEKVQAIAGRSDVLQSLRVCWENPANEYNCGRCEKCIRTMINLETAGALERCTAFDAALDPAVVARMTIPFDLVLFHVEENLRVLRAQHGQPALINALETAIARYEARRVAKQMASVKFRHWRYVLGALVDGFLRRYTRHQDAK